MAAELLAGVDIADMHFHSREAYTAYSVRDGVGVMCVGAGIDHDGVGPVYGVVDDVDDLAFVIALAELDRKSK